MSKYDSFINKYSISKTLRFSLIPIGKTEENFNAQLLLEQDKERAANYKIVKNCIDDYHRYYIEKRLSRTSDFDLSIVKNYAELYYKQGKTKFDLQAIEKMENDMRKIVAQQLISGQNYKKIKGKEIITKILPDFLKANELNDNEKIIAVEKFKDFTTYFTGFNKNRENMYTDKPQSTAIAYRCINENLPKFLDNCKNFKKIIEAIPEDVKELNLNYNGLYGMSIEDAFNVDYFVFVLSQLGIDNYNRIIGGYTCSDQTKVKGINEYVNLYNQQYAKKDKNKRLPLMKPLYKQILTKSNSVSFVPDKFNDDNEVINAINTFYKQNIEIVLSSLKGIFNDFTNYDLDGIYIKSNAISLLSNCIYKNWNLIFESWSDEYRANYPKKANQDEEKYFENLSKEYKSIKSFSLSEFNRLAGLRLKENDFISIEKFYQKYLLEKIDYVTDIYINSQDLFTTDYIKNNDIKLCKNVNAIEKIKDLLDGIKELERMLYNLLGTGKEENKDDDFYGTLLPNLESLSDFTQIYDKVRNYITQKPYSKDKIKLNFECSSFLNGWTQKFESKESLIFTDNNSYYVGIINNKLSNDQINKLYNESEKSSFKHIIYNSQKPNYKNTPRMFIRSKGSAYAPAVSQYNLPLEDIIDIYDNGYFKTSYQKINEELYRESLFKIIEYYKLGFTKHNSYNHFNFNWKKSEEYDNINEFYDDVLRFCYRLEFKNINSDYLNNLVDSGQLYLFKIYNKDFSKNSHGTPNLHTLYFKMLFDEQNLKDVVYQLNGGAEIFYREASINDKEKIVHPANKPIKNKNSLNQKSESLFDYDIIKDKRFTKRQFLLHLPITLNFKAQGREIINDDVRLAVKNSNCNYVIGIDRGERNLLYICVVNNNGEIVEQKSLNQIISDNGYKVDYHNLLNDKEKQRDNARKSWSTVENIKELKEGYLSQVIHEICKLAIKYDALIAMEDLNFGFKKGRFKVEKQVYQKFENMLISKLNYLVDKKQNPDEKGGLLNAYQLTNKVTGVNKSKQNGIIFYVPAWLTSKIDPSTGFVNLLNTKYVSVDATKKFIEKIDNIRYSENENLFEFEIDYSKFERCSVSYVQKWTVCSNGERVINIRNFENNIWESKTIILTDEFKALFNNFNIDFRSSDLKENILAQCSKDFFKKFLQIFSYMLQMRNSITGTDIDYLLSPVKNKNGKFFDSRTAGSNFPQNADANGAYNIARKALWVVEQIKKSNDIKDVDILIKNADWLELAQK